MGLLEQLARELNGGQVGFRDVPSGVPDSQMYTGPNGLFGTLGIERQLISTVVSGNSVASRIPAFGTEVLWPYFGYITGFQDISGEEADGPCDDPPMGGPMKSCLQTAHFGNYSRMTRELDIRRVGERINRGEFDDYVILNNPGLDSLGLLSPNVAGRDGIPDFRREVMLRMMELGISFQRLMGRQVYIGNPTNATNGGYDEFPGLDILVGTGKVDARDGVTTCPSLDSQVINFAYAKVDADGGATLLNRLVYTMRYLRHLAESTGLDPVKHVFVMRPDLFYEITAIWPCNYMTYRCVFPSAADQATLNVNATDAIAMRDAMRTGKYLVVDGERFEVITDTYIIEEDEDHGSVDAGCYASDIYILPLTVAGNVASLYWQYKDFTTGIQAASDMNAGQYFWTDSGRWIWHVKPPNNWCIQAMASIWPRLVLRTPHLAARIQNVQYCPLQHVRSAMPDEGDYVNGGTLMDGTALATEPPSEWSA